MKFRNDIPEGGGGKNFLKLKDKESISGIFMGDIQEFYVLWENGKSREVPEGTEGAKFRFRVNFVVKEGSVYVPRIFEQGLMVYRQLAELNDEYNLEDTVIKITRNGTGTDTAYSTLPLLKQEITPTVKKHLATIELLPLVTKRGEASGAGEPDGGEVPF